MYFRPTIKINSQVLEGPCFSASIIEPDKISCLPVCDAAFTLMFTHSRICIIISSSPFTLAPPSRKRLEKNGKMYEKHGDVNAPVNINTLKCIIYMRIKIISM